MWSVSGGRQSRRVAGMCVAGGQDGHVRVWDPREKKNPKRIMLHVTKEGKGAVSSICGGAGLTPDRPLPRRTYPPGCPLLLLPQLQPVWLHTIIACPLSPCCCASLPTAAGGAAAANKIVSCGADMTFRVLEPRKGFALMNTVKLQVRTPVNQGSSPAFSSLFCPP